MTLAACGGSDPAPADAPIDDPIPDAAPLGPFGAAVAVAELNTIDAAEEDPALTADQLEIFFVSNRLGGVGGNDIYTATRGSTTEPWGPVSNVAELNTIEGETHPHVAPDGLSMYLSSNRAGGLGAADIYFTSRMARTDPWGPPTRVLELSSATGDFSAFPDPSGLILVLASNRTGTIDLFLSTRLAVTDAWRGPAAIGTVNTASNDQDGVLADGGKALYFATGTGAMVSGNELMVSTRPSIDVAFGPATPVSELNTMMNELDPWIADDQRTIYFNSDRAGTEDLHVATR